MTDKNTASIIDKGFVMRILLEDVSVDTEENMKFIDHENVIRKINEKIKEARSETIKEIKEIIDNWAEEDYLGGELGDEDSDIFEMSIGSFKNSLRNLKKKLADLGGKA